MSGKSFMNISRNECLIFYKDILTNSDKKWDSASLLAESGDYGSAFSTAIISIEELIKSIILLMDGKGFDFRSVKGINTIFKNHNIRYLLAYLIFILSVLGEDIINLILKYRTQPNELIKLGHRIKSDKQFQENEIKNYIHNKIIIFNQEIEWFEKMDVFRQDGFYCDYNDSLKTPINISSDDYSAAITRIEKVRNFGKKFIESFETNENFYSEEITKLNTNFRENNIYKKIEKSLNSIKFNKQNLFEPAKNILKEFSKSIDNIK